MRILFVGDPHIRVENFGTIDRLIEMIQGVIEKHQVQLVVVAGDVLHTHERLHTLALNKSVDFLLQLGQLTRVVCLVGNHDYINNQQFLSTNHWMHHYRGKLENVTVVDRPLSERFEDGSRAVFVPYTYPGRFVEALSAVEGWHEADVVFAHQEFKGCKMGAITSEVGDEWDTAWPQVVSGHIHDYQRPQPNVFYPGTPMQHSFGDRGGNIVLLIDTAVGGCVFTEIPTDVDKKRTVYVTVDDVAALVEKGIASTESEQVKVAIRGTSEEFKVFKESKEYKDLVRAGVKVAFKQEARTKPTLPDEASSSASVGEVTDFESILTDLLKTTGNAQVLRDYREVFHNMVFIDPEEDV